MMSVGRSIKLIRFIIQAVRSGYFLIVLLKIKNTDLNGGLEYLPESLEELYCQGTKLEEELVGYKKRCYYDYQA